MFGGLTRSGAASAGAVSEMGPAVGVPAGSELDDMPEPPMSMPGMLPPEPAEQPARAMAAAIPAADMVVYFLFMEITPPTGIEVRLLAAGSPERD